MDYVENGATSGTTGEAKRVEAIKIELTGTEAQNYDIYYRAHCQTYGWLDWAKNGERPEARVMRSGWKLFRSL